jgi:hypothetical protein
MARNKRPRKLTQPAAAVNALHGLTSTGRPQHIGAASIDYPKID